jgi:hypothetical protein
MEGLKIKEGRETVFKRCWEQTPENKRVNMK